MLHIINSIAIIIILILLNDKSKKNGKPCGRARSFFGENWSRRNQNTGSFIAMSELSQYGWI
jgi:hypothetical protein